MSERRFRFGVVVSIAWLLVMAWVACYDPAVARGMKPNEWGDFFAGFFAPLAFLWLVLGYLQQGQELQLSTKALHLQAEELKNSVQQQRELVEVTRQQVESDREALLLERTIRQEAAKPRFDIQNQGGSSGNSGNYHITITNAGNTATKVIGTIEGVSGTSTLFNIPMFVREIQHGAVLSVTEPFPDSGATLTITYIDADGRPGTFVSHVAKQDATPNGMLSFLPVGG
jgi:hypothetical protein